MKKLLAVLLTICLVAVICPFNVSAATVVASGDCGAQGGNVKWSLDSNGTLTISGKGDMENIPMGTSQIQDTVIIQNGVWEAWADKIKKVVLQGGVTNISGQAFAGLTSLSDVTIPSSVTVISESAFYGCKSLSNIIIPASVAVIGEDAFSMSGITNIDIPQSVTRIERGAFAKCENLISVEMPNGITVIEEGVFRRCTNLTSILIPASVTRIEGGIYWEDFNVDSEGRYFDDYGNIVMDIISWGAAFSGCISLTDVYYSGTQAQWSQIDIRKRDTYNKYLTSANIHYNSISLPAATPPKPTVGGFNDVYEGEYCADAVVWAVSEGVTNGIGGGKFGPGQSCTRGQIVTFLWNAAGKPEPTSTENPFADVAESDYFYKPVLWAAENNITGGTGTNASGQAVFSPGNTCTRAQAVTFQWRAAGEPSAGAGGKFTDVASGSYYEQAVNWAVENGITQGTTPTQFAPNKICNRGQIVTFLYRYKK